MLRQDMQTIKTQIKEIISGKKGSGEIILIVCVRLFFSSFFPLFFSSPFFGGKGRVRGMVEKLTFYYKLCCADDRSDLIGRFALIYPMILFGQSANHQTGLRDGRSKWSEFTVQLSKTKIKSATLI